MYDFVEGHEQAFSVDTNAITFGRGCIEEVGPQAAKLGLKRVAVMTDPRVAELELCHSLLRSLRAAAIDVEVYRDVGVEPTDVSFRAAAAFASEGCFDGYVSVGGGSVIDTTKAANLLASHPAELHHYVNAPVGAGQEVPGPLAPHIACPTTSGTGSECTGIAIFDDLSLHAKTGIAHRHLRPTCAFVDPDATKSLPGLVVAASGFDVLSHALESFTARPFTRRAKGGPRPMSQGANPWSDIGCREALRLCGQYLVRASLDGSDDEAREQMMWAATLAGIAFGNAGVHVPHGMAYAVAGLVESYCPPSYPQGAPMVPHGISVILNAPAVFAFTAETNPERHLEGARLLGDATDAQPEDAGALLGQRLATMMKAVALPNGLSGVGYDASHVDALTAGAIVQQRLLQNAPRPIDEASLRDLYRSAMTCW